MCCYIFSLLSQSARNTGSKTKATISHCENLQACLLRRSQVANITILMFCPQLSSNSQQAVFMLMTLLSLIRLLKRNVHHFFACSVLFVSHHPIYLKKVLFTDCVCCCSGPLLCCGITPPSCLCKYILKMQRKDLCVLNRCLEVSQGVCSHGYMGT